MATTGKVDAELTAELSRSPEKGSGPVRGPAAGVLRHPGTGQGRGTSAGSLSQSSHGPRGRHAQLPVKADVRRAIGKEAGDTVTVRLEERLG